MTRTMYLRQIAFAQTRLANAETQADANNAQEMIDHLTENLRILDENEKIAADRLRALTQ